jgi:hypothetical protein
MKINKKTLEALIEEEIHALINEGFASSFVRGLTKGGKRDNFLTDFIASALVPQSTKLAHESAKELAKNLDNMRNNAEWKKVARMEDGEGEPAMEIASALPRALTIMKKGGISINGLHRAAQAIVADIEMLGKQLGSDAPEMKSDDQPSDSSAPEEDASSADPAADDSGSIPARKAARAASGGTRAGGDPFDVDDNISENLRRQIRKRLRQLKTTS